MNQKMGKVETSELTDLRSIRTRELLRTALLKLLEQRSLDEIVIRDITTTARVGYATFYRHYPTKEALLDDLAREQVEHLVNMSLPVLDSANTLAAYTTLFSYVDQHRSMWTTLLTGGAASAIKQQLLHLSREVAATRSVLDSAPATELRVVLVVTCTVELLAWWLGQPNPMSVDDIAKTFDDTIISPMMTRRSPPYPR